VSAMPQVDRACIATIVRCFEPRLERHYFILGPEGDTWRETIPPGQCLHFAVAEHDEFKTDAAFSQLLEPSTLQKFGQALQAHRLTGAVPVRDKESSFVQAAPLTPAPWVEEVTTKMKELARLPVNWDSYGAKLVKAECMQYAVHGVLQECMHGTTPAPSVVPTNTGGVMLEWHRGKIDLEVRVEIPGEATVYYADAEVPEEKEFVFDRSSELLASLLWKLTQRG